jgi:ankyrin repeat protein
MFINIKGSRDKGGNTALLCACNNHSSHSDYMLVQYLIDEADADPNISNDTFRNALLLGVKKNQINAIDLLLQRGVDINATDANGCKYLFP